MRVIRVLPLAAFVFSLVILAQTMQAQATAVTAVLPPVTAYALDKTKLKLPADFSAPLNLLILSFTHDQQTAVDTWLPVAAQAQSAYPKVQPWVLPVSARTDNLYKWWMNSSMRNRLPNNESERYTVPLYVDKTKFLQSLAIHSEKQIVVLVTGKAGAVLWRGEGAATEANKTSLNDFLKASPLAR